MVASIGCSFSGTGFLFQKPLSQIQRRTLLFLQQASYTPSFGGLGLTLINQQPPLTQVQGCQIHQHRLWLL